MANDTRARLLDAAWSRVCDAGIAGATSRAITDEADANLGAITYHFGSKDQLLAEAFVAAIRRLITPALDALQEEGADPTARVVRAIALLQESLTASTAEAPAYLEILVQSHRVPALQDQIGELFAELRGVLALQMAGQQNEGLLPDWVDPASMAGLLLAVAQGVVLQATVDQDGPREAAMANQFAHLLVASR